MVLITAVTNYGTDINFLIALGRNMNEQKSKLVKNILQRPLGF